MSTPVLGMLELVQSQAMPETTVNEIARILEQGARLVLLQNAERNQ